MVIGIASITQYGNVQSPVYTEQLGYFTALEWKHPVPDIADVDYDGEMDLASVSVKMEPCESILIQVPLMMVFL